MAPGVPIQLRVALPLLQRGRRLPLSLAVLASLLLATAGVTGPVQATFGGRDGRVVVSHSEFSGGQYRAALFTMNPDGTAQTQLTSPDWGFADTSPKWSPDGTKIAFERDDNTQGYSEIYVVNANGSGLTRITDCAGQRTGASPFDFCGGYFGPVWTPDGTSIVLTRCCLHEIDGDHQGIYAMRADGTGLRELTYSPDPNGGDDGVAVSPDGQWVAFSRQITDHNFDQHTLSAMFLVHMDGSGLHQVTPYDRWVDEKDWSPDGSRIVFVTHNGSNHGPFRADIDTIRPDGTGLTQLTSTVPGQTFAFSPKWSPAGDRIMFDFFPGPDGQTNVYTMRPDGTDIQIVLGTSNDNPTDWGTAPIN